MSSSAMFTSTKTVWLKALVLFHLFAGLPSTNVQLTKIFNTTSGPLRGKSVSLPNNKTILQFLGIPYAQAERFELPREQEQWPDVIEVIKHGKTCPQPSTSFGVNSHEDTSEVCQNLNIYITETQQDANFPHIKTHIPVIVWFGGIFYSFGDAGKRYDGSLIASEGDVIVVTFNYRLGILGFLSTGSPELKGNYGLADQVMALKWVRKNIERFGGDPNHVTLLGHSSGAMSVGLLLVSPEAHGLYKYAILMSGSPLSLAATVDSAKAVERARQIGKALRCNDIKNLKSCLKTKFLSEIITAQRRFQNTPISSPFAPVVDGIFLPDVPEKLYKKGVLAVASVMIGTVQHDGSLFISGHLPGVISSKPGTIKAVNRSTLKDVINQNKWTRNKSNVAKLIQYEYTYWKDPDDAARTQQSLMDLYSDSTFIAPAIRVADILSRRGVPTFYYHLEHAFTNKTTFARTTYWRGVSHGDDISDLFAIPTADVSDSGAPQLALDGKKVVKVFTDFSKTGNPTPSQHSGIPKWPYYTVHDGQYMSLKPSLAVNSKLFPQRMALWNDLLPSLGLEQEPPTMLTPAATTHSSDRANKYCNAKKNKTTKALIAIVAIMAIVIVIMLSTIIYQGRTLSKRNDSSARQSL